MPADGQIDLSNPHFRAELAREQTRLAAHQAEAQRAGGVCQSGMGPEPIKARTIEQIFQAAERNAALANSPRAQFLRAVNELGALTYGPEAETLLAIYWRSMSDDRRPVDTDAALRAVRILNGINHSTAREAVQALCDFAAPILGKVA